MIFAVDISENRTVQLIADEAIIEDNGYGASIVKFYNITDDLEARDKSGHKYAQFNVRKAVGSYYIDKICGFRPLTSITEEEFNALDRAYILDAAPYDLVDDEESEDDYDEDDGIVTLH